MIATARQWPPAHPVINLAASSISWKRLWEIVRAELTRRGLSPATIQLHRHSLRSFIRRHPTDRPSRVTESLVWSYLGDLTDTHSSAFWLSAKPSNPVSSANRPTPVDHPSAFSLQPFFHRRCVHNPAIGHFLAIPQGPRCPFGA
jgi:hypothetical protein